MADTSAARSGGGGASHHGPRSGKLLRRSNSDRLRMHAPSSIQVAAPSTSCAAEWKVAIPLLSPLDLESASWPGDPAPAEAARRADEASSTAAAEDEERRSRWATWQHPAAPFYYEPVPAGKAAAFLLPHCA